MAQRSDTEYQTFLVDVIGDEVSLSHSRDRGGDQINGVFYPSLVQVPSRIYPAQSQVLPWYKGNNNEPEYLMTLIANNPTLLGLILTKCSILNGMGLTLFRVEGKERIPLRVEEYPEEIRDFVEYNRLAEWAYSAFCDFELVGNAFAALLFSSRSRVLNIPKKIVEINRNSPECVRAYKPTSGFAKIARYAIASTWDIPEDQNQVQDVAAYDHRSFYSEQYRFQPGGGDAAQVMWHIKRVMPCYPHYGIPHWYGARFHIELQNEIPRWHISNIVNQFGGRLQIHVHQKYIQKLMQEENPDTQKKYTEREIKEKLSTMIRDLFTNPINVGKSLLTGYVTDHQGKPIKDILIEPIKLDINDSAYTALDPSINNKITSSVGVQAALAALITDKGMSSGSEMTQAWNIECAKAITTQNKILEPIQFIHRYNAWPTDLEWGFENPSLVTKDIEPSGVIPDAQIPTTPE